MVMHLAPVTGCTCRCLYVLSPSPVPAPGPWPPYPASAHEAVFNVCGPCLRTVEPVLPRWQAAGERVSAFTRVPAMGRWQAATFSPRVSPHSDEGALAHLPILVGVSDWVGQRTSHVPGHAFH